jgi:hypothetical protein
VARLVAQHVRLLPSDFVECGVSRGGMARAVMEYVDFLSLDKTFYLLDIYCGIPAEMKSANVLRMLKSHLQIVLTLESSEGSCRKLCRLLIQTG